MKGLDIDVDHEGRPSPPDCALGRAWLRRFADDRVRFDGQFHGGGDLERAAGFGAGQRPGFADRDHHPGFIAQRDRGRATEHGGRADRGRHVPGPWAGH
jgi:hypothetical protein